MKKVLEQRIKQHPKDKYLMFVYKFKIAIFKTEQSKHDEDYIFFQCYFNKWNPLSWVYVFIKSLQNGLKGFKALFMRRWTEIINSHYISRGVDMKLVGGGQGEQVSKESKSS